MSSEHVYRALVGSGSLHSVSVLPPPFEMHLEEDNRSGSADLFNNLGAGEVT